MSEYDDSIAFQRRLVADNQVPKEGDPDPKSLRDIVCRDPATGQPLDRGQMFDHHAVCLAVCLEFGDRMLATDGLIRWGK